ncbi:MAG: cytochrome b [Deltaproteobacteria bacterium]|nr:MAG: cytochrome b [Deltaproteobacteria bacterium]
MKRILVWDLPIRLFHWLLAAAFVAAYGIANLVDDDSPAFSLHMVVGLVMAFMVALRVVWGVVGTRYARFPSFLFGPRAVFGYFAGLARAEKPAHVGHNPGSSVAIFAMLAWTVGLAVTGVMMGRGSEAAEELHEVFATLLLVTVLAHVAGVALHSLRHRENLVMSMIDGHKLGAEADAIRSSRPVVALVFLALTAVWSWRLVAGYDGAARRLDVPLIGTVQLGETEHEGGERHGHRGHDDDDDD